MFKVIDLTGQRFGKLTVVEKSTFNNFRTNVLWRCRCDCGNETTAWSYALRRGDTTSCGCNRGGKNMTYQCDFNPNVICSVKACTHCGWNPEVAKARLEEFMEKGVVTIGEENASGTDSGVHE